MELKREGFGGEGIAIVKIDSKFSEIGGQVLCQELEWSRFQSGDPMDTFEEICFEPSTTKQVVHSKVMAKPVAEDHQKIGKIKTRWINRYAAETKTLPALISANEIETQE